MLLVPPARVQFSHSSVEREGQTMVTCSATDIYPSPVARIYWKDGLVVFIAIFWTVFYIFFPEGERKREKTITL